MTKINMNLYQREDGNRLPMDIARQVTFGGNPLLFVGLGMGEDDILRPLRQFMGQDSRIGDRLAVAIMPGDKRRKARLLEQMTLLNRYGVYGVYYGAARLSNQKATDDWLAIIIELIEAMKALTESGADTSLDLALCLKYMTKAYDSFTENADKPAEPDPMSFVLSPPLELDKFALHDIGLNLDFEMRVLRACFNTLQHHAATGLTKDILVALRISLEGVRTAIQSACLCARLHRLEREWQDWKLAWYDLPEPRQVRPTTPRQYGASRRGWLGPGFKLTHRHMVELPDIKEPNRAARFFRDPPSRALSALEGAMRDLPLRTLSAIHGRRIFLLLSRPGVGKGHIFSSLAGEEGLGRFLAASWGQDYTKTQEPSVSYLRAAFFNLGFSHEVASVFDRLAQFLFEAWPYVFGDTTFGAPVLSADLQQLHDALEEGVSGFENYRRGRLTHILDIYARTVAQGHRWKTRLVVAISNASTLYDEDGLPKNSGLTRMFDLLIDRGYANLPIDLVLLCSTLAVPPQFRAQRQPESTSVPRVDRMLRIVASPASQVHREEVLTAERQLGLCSSFDAADYSAQPLGEYGYVAWHLLRSTPPALIASSFFPRLAIAMTLHAAYQIKLLDYKNYSNITTKQLLRHQEKMNDFIIYAHKTNGKKFTKTYVEIITMYNLLIRIGFTQDDRTFIKWIISRKKIMKKDAEWQTKLNYMQRCFDVLGPNTSKHRFGLSLLFAAADEQIGPQAAGLTWQQGQRAVSFIEQARARLEGLTPLHQNALLAEMALDAMAERHRARQPPPIDMGQVHTLGPALYEALLLILWHVAVIGEPVDAEVLLYCPEIRKAFEIVAIDEREVKVDAAIDRNALIRQLIKQSLSLLIHRCLLFEASQREQADRSPQPVPRYGIHRMMQRVIFRLLDTPLGAFRAMDRFSISLYYAQPSDLPRPSLEAHHRLRKLAQALSGYPDSGPRPADASTREQEAEIETWPWRLRAAFGILSTVYHVAIIGRFDSYGSQDTSGTPDLGHFEAHRQLVRWLLRQARELVLRKEKRPYVAPFYAEEIVWLLNESGVLSLVQGRINDATALFEQATRATRAWLAPGHSALTQRIELNAAIAEIERGAGARVRPALERILADDREHPANRALARGMIAWIDHLAGELVAAEAGYGAAIQDLLRHRQMRTASIFMMRRGDLFRARGEPHYAAAAQELRAAETLAREGAHEDVAQLARLAYARLLVEAGDPVRLADALEELDASEDYAKAVGLPRMLTEVASVRAEAVLQQGETRRATELAAQALGIATLHDLRMYKARALAVLAAALYRQRAFGAADLVRRRADELARRSKYTSMVRRLEQRDADAGRLRSR